MTDLEERQMLYLELEELLRRAEERLTESDGLRRKFWDLLAEHRVSPRAGSGLKEAVGAVVRLELQCIAARVKLIEDYEYLNALGWPS